MVQIIQYTFIITFIAYIKALSSSITSDNKTLYSVSIRGFNIINSNQAKIVKDSFLSIITNLNNEISFTGKICYAERLEDFTENCVKAYRKLIKHWIVQVKDISTFKIIQKYIKDFKDTQGRKLTDIKAFFFNDETLTPSTVIDIDDLRTPILIFNKSTYEDIYNRFTITKENDDAFLKITFYRLIEANQKQAAIGITIVKIVMFVGMNLTWFILKKKIIIEENDFTYIQGIVDNAMFFILLKELITIYYLIRANSVSDDLNRDAYLEIIINSIDAIIRSLVCLLFISVSKGYGIFRSKLIGLEIKQLLGIFVVIYLVFFVDQVLSSPLGILIYYGIEVKDIKNLVLMCVLLSFVIYYGIRSIIILTRKTRELFAFNLEYAVDNADDSITILKNKRLVIM